MRNQDCILSSLGVFSQFSTAGVSKNDLFQDLWEDFHLPEEEVVSHTHEMKSLVWEDEDSFYLTPKGCWEACLLTGTKPSMSLLKDILLATLGEALLHKTKTSISKESWHKKAMAYLGVDTQDVFWEKYIKWVDLFTVWGEADTSLQKESLPMFLQTGMQISLTYSGIIHSLEKVGQILTKKPNVTSLWLGDQAAGLYRAMRNIISRKLPSSLTMGLVDDHVHDYMILITEKDAFRRYLKEGRKISYAQIGFWAYRTAVSELRGWGRDASLRDSRNARTQKEVKQMEGSQGYSEDGFCPKTEVDAISCDKGVSWSFDEEHGGGAVRDFKGGNLVEEAQESIFFNGVVKRIETMIVNKFGEEKPLTVFRQLLASSSVKEISENLGEPKNIVTSLVGKLRRFLKSDKALVQEIRS